MKKSFKYPLVLLLALALMLAQVGLALATAGGATLISFGTGSDLANGGSYFSSSSGDGRYVAFASYASNLVSGDANGVTDIFTRDTQTSNTARVSVSSSSTEANGASDAPVFSANGRYVAFQSVASNLVSADTNGKSDIFVRDTLTGTTTLVSVSSSGAQGNDGSYSASISADGHYVAFQSAASNLVSADTNGKSDIFVRDTQNNITTRISLSSSSTEANGGSYAPYISSDGRYVAFTSDASNLVSGDTNGVDDIFVRDTLAGTTGRVSLDTSGAQANDASGSASISANGRYVVFQSDATNLVSADLNGVTDIFMRDTQTNTTTRVSVASNGAGGDGQSRNCSISSDGRYVVFVSFAGNLAGADTNGKADIFMRDTQTNSTTRLSQDTNGVGANAQSDFASISADGCHATYFSSATNLVSGNTNGTALIYTALTDTTAPTVLSSTRVSASPTGHASVNFTVTFSEPVYNVTAGNFSLTPSGDLTGAAVSSVSGSGAVYTVTANTGTGNGSLRLDVVTGGSIRDCANTPLASGLTNGDVYTVSKVTIIGNAGAAGVTLSYVDGTPQTVTSAANGAYVLPVLPGWSGTVTPSRPSTIFSPVNRAYTALTSDQTIQNFSSSPNAHVIDDFNSDGKTDLAVWRSPTGYWYIHYADGTSSSKQWGNSGSGDLTQPGDYNGDGSADYAVWRPSNGTWYIKYANDSTYTQQWGTSSDIPVPGDYNGDGKTDVAYWRPSNGTWYVHYMDGTSASQQWGNSGAGDVPVPADYNGDGKTEFAVWRPSNGTWYIRYADGTSASRQWGNSAVGDIPLPGDYNGDGLAELAVWRAGNASWYIKYADDSSSSQQWGSAGAGDVPVLGDFNGDGKTDYAYWLPSNGTWYVKYADGGTYTQQWGNSGAGDIPLPRR